MPAYAYPTTRELERIDPVLMQNTATNTGSPVLRIFPFKGKNSAVIEWEQRDNYTGLMQARGYNGMPPKVDRKGVKTYLMKPGVYGEHIAIDEMELTTRRAMNPNSPGTPVDATDLVMEAKDQLNYRLVARVEWILWQLVLTGKFFVSDARNVLVHADSYTPQQYTAPVAWGTTATASPLADFRAVQLLGRGQSAEFGAGAEAWMNRTTANQLLANTNALDFGGRRTTGLAPVNSINGMNAILAGEGLPQIKVYDEGYQDDANAFQLWIPNNKALLIGKRSNGASIGNWFWTLNNNNRASRPYTKVFDRTEDNVPGGIEVHSGFNGGPALYFPGSLVVMTV